MRTCRASPERESTAVNIGHFRIVEVEAMYANGSVYIGANAESHSDLIYKVFKSGTETENMLFFSERGNSVRERVTPA